MLVLDTRVGYPRRSNVAQHRVECGPQPFIHHPNRENLWLMPPRAPLMPLLLDTRQSVTSAIRRIGPRQEDVDVPLGSGENSRPTQEFADDE